MANLLKRFLRRRAATPEPKPVDPVTVDPGLFFLSRENVDDFDTSSPIAEYFWNNTGHPIDKWLHYFPVYDAHMRRFRGEPVNILEIGVQNGGSARMLLDFLGPQARLWGIDIDPTCAAHATDRISIHIGSQDDPECLRRVVEEAGSFDIILDDGSHDSAHITASFDNLFPHLRDGGVYIVEDTHALYWPGFSGGYRRRDTFIEQCKRLVDDMHHWYHDRGVERSVTRDKVSGVHFYDSVVVIDKQPVHRPRRVVTGKKAVS